MYITLEPLSYIDSKGRSVMWPEGMEFDENSECYPYFVKIRILHNTQLIKQTKIKYKPNFIFVSTRKADDILYSDNNEQMVMVNSDKGIISIGNIQIDIDQETYKKLKKLI